MAEESAFGKTVFAAERFQIDIFFAVELKIGGDALYARFHEAVARAGVFATGKQKLFVKLKCEQIKPIGNAVFAGMLHQLFCTLQHFTYLRGKFDFPDGRHLEEICGGHRIGKINGIGKVDGVARFGDSVPVHDAGKFQYRIRIFRAVGDASDFIDGVPFERGKTDCEFQFPVETGLRSDLVPEKAEFLERKGKLHCARHIVEPDIPAFIAAVRFHFTLP